MVGGVAAGRAQVVVGLEVHPEAGRGAEEAAQAQRRVGGDGALAQHDLVDPPRRHVQRAGQPGLAQGHRFEKVLAQDLTGVDGRKVRIGHRAAKLALVIIGNLDVVGVAVGPDKADAPLVVDADPVLAFAITL